MQQQQTCGMAKTSVLPATTLTGLGLALLT